MNTIAPLFYKSLELVYGPCMTGHLTSLAVKSESFIDGPDIYKALDWNKASEGYYFWKEVEEEVSSGVLTTRIYRSFAKVFTPTRARELAKKAMAAPHFEDASNIAYTHVWSDSVEGRDFWQEIATELVLLEQADG